MDPMQFAKLLQQGQQSELAGIGSSLGLQVAGAMGGLGLGAMGAPALASAAPGLGAEAAVDETAGMSPTAKAGLIGMLASSLGSIGQDQQRFRSRVGMPAPLQLNQFRPY